MDEAREKDPKNTIISEIITHVNQLESRINSLEESISEANDLQIVNKLDIINLKNELEKVKLAFPAVSPENIERFQQLSKSLDKSSFQSVKELEKKVDDVQKTANDLAQRLTFIESYPAETEEVKKVESPSEPSEAVDVQKIIDDVKAEQNEQIAIMKKSIESMQTPKNIPVQDPRVKELEIALANVKLDVQNLSKKMHPAKQKTEEKPWKADISLLQSVQQKIEKSLAEVREEYDQGNQAKDNEIFRRIGSLSSQLADMKKQLVAKKEPKQQPKGTPVKRSPDLEKRMQELTRSLVGIRKEIKNVQKESRERVEKGKKEAFAYILKELRRVVS